MNYSQMMWICLLIQMTATVLCLFGLGTPGTTLLGMVGFIPVLVFSRLAYNEAKAKRDAYMKAAQQRIINANRRFKQ